MAKIELEINKIQIEIPDLIMGESLIKRKATLYSFTYDQMNKYLSLSWMVEFFETLEDGTYGELISKQGITPYVKDVVANNSIMVDVTNGNEIYPSEVVTLNEETGESVKTMEYDQTITYTGQYDWFNALADAQPIEIHNMIKVYGARTNWN